MHYYQFNIGDYRKDTAHLSIIEHGIYRQLIDIYYLEEGPLPDKQRLMRLLCIRIADEERALDNVLADFFLWQEGTGFINKRCDEELSGIYDKSELARKAAKERWKKYRENQTVNADAMHPHSISNTGAMQPNNPIPNTQDKDKTHLSESCDSSTPNCPIQEIVGIYHDVLPMLPRVRVMTKARETQIRQRWREDTKRQTLEWWHKFFSYVSKSDLLTGKVESKDRSSPWMADFEWLTKAGNFAKVIEGKYNA